MRKSTRLQLSAALDACTAPAKTSDQQPSFSFSDAAAETLENGWPAAFEEFRIDDRHCAEAYEETPSAWRARIKTGLALGLMHISQGAQPGALCSEQRQDIRLGCLRGLQRRPAPWALLIVDSHYGAAARLTAAALCAQLAEVPRIAAVCIGGEPQPSLLTALDLCGIEDIFSVPEATALPFFSQLHGQGCVVLLHSSALKERFQVVASYFQEKGIACFQEQRPPRIFLASPEAFPQDLLQFCHGNNFTLLKDEHTLPPDVCFIKAADTASLSAQHNCLILSPGCEGLWIHHGLTPDFFSHYQYHFALLEKHSPFCEE